MRVPLDGIIINVKLYPFQTRDVGRGSMIVLISMRVHNHQEVPNATLTPHCRDERIYCK
jgi:hypothetical protein